MRHYRVTVDLSTPEDLELDGPRLLLAEVDEKEFRRARPGDGGEERIMDFIKELSWNFLFARGAIPPGLVAGLRAGRIVVSEQQELDWNLENLAPDVARDGVKLLYLPQLR